VDSDKYATETESIEGDSETEANSEDAPASEDQSLERDFRGKRDSALNTIEKNLGSIEPKPCVGDLRAIRGPYTQMSDDFVKEMPLDKLFVTCIEEGGCREKEEGVSKAVRGARGPFID
jgi:hypothetical protein